MTERLRAHLARNPGDDLADVAFTLQASRGAFALRRAIVVHGTDDAIAALDDPSRWLDHKTRRRNPKVRLVTSPDTPAEWWSQLEYAIDARIVSGGGGARTAGSEKPDAGLPDAAASDSDPATKAARDSALGALAEWLGRLGVSTLTGAAAAAASPGAPHQAAAEEIVVAPEGGTSAAEWLLGTVARIWLAGCAVDWAVLHGGAGRRVQLPTYPFRRHRYWVEPKPRASNGSDLLWPGPEQAGKTYDRSQWTYQPTWQPRPCRVTGLDERAGAAGPWLVFAADERGEALIRRLRQVGADVTAVRPGERFERTAAGDFAVRVAAKGDMRQLISGLADPPRAIVHAFSLADTGLSPAGEPAARRVAPPGVGAEASPGEDAVAGFDAGQESGFYSALALASALVDESGAAPRAEVALLTSGAVGVTGADLRHPEHATLAALPPSLAQENPRLRCRHIDVDAVPDGQLGLLTTQVLAAALSPYEGPMAVRAGEAWLRRYQPFPAGEPPEDDGPVRRGDTVLITGGLGDIGLVLSRHLAGKYGCQLVLTARSPLPPRAEWAQYLDAAPPAGDRAARHIANILDLEQRGAEVLAVSADAADPDQMRAVVAAANDRFGPIDVAVHAAGVQDANYFNYAHLVSRAACDAHLAAKVRGFHVLQNVLGEQAAGLRLTFSSLAAVLGGITLAPYAAANAALDAYARQARSRGAGQWITVDWDTWSIDPDRLAGHGPGVTDYAMVPAEALDVFERALAAGDRVGHLVISTGSLAARIQQWVTADLHDADGQDDDDTAERHPRPDLGTAYQPPREGIETILAEILVGRAGHRARGGARQLLRARRPLAGRDQPHRADPQGAGRRDPDHRAAGEPDDPPAGRPDRVRRAGRAARPGRGRRGRDRGDGRCDSLST